MTPLFSGPRSRLRSRPRPRRAMRSCAPWLNSTTCASARNATSRSAQRFALERFAAELLGVRDSLELAVKSAEAADARSLAEGQQATLQLLARAFEQFSIQRIDPLGAPFDPALHEAVVMQESATAPADSVLQVLQSGYQLNGRLLRPARVVVARAPQQPA